MGPVSWLDGRGERVRCAEETEETEETEDAPVVMWWSGLAWPAMLDHRCYNITLPSHHPATTGYCWQILVNFNCLL